MEDVPSDETVSTHGASGGDCSASPFGEARTARRFHHYEVCLREDGTTLHELGRGAVGISYKARDVNLDAPVALKIINAQFSGHADMRERFRREARAAAQLRHPNVASVFHFGETPEGECFYAMEFIEGETLEALVRREGPLPPALVLEIALQVNAALIAAEGRGIVHRDLKPSNLMLAARKGTSVVGRDASTHRLLVKVIDFGLAKSVVVPANIEGAQAMELTRGFFLGTPQYASPEQFEGGQIDARSDIYCLGATLWYLLTATAPFSGRSLTEIHDRKLHRALPLAQLADFDVPPSFVSLLATMLAANPHRRPASPTVLEAMLEGCCEDEAMRKLRAPSTALASGLASPVNGPRGWKSPAAIVVATMLVLGAVAFAFFRHSAPHAASDFATPALLLAAEKSVAVLPFENADDDPTNSFFADGLQDDVLASLAKIRELVVISRASVSSFHGARDSARLQDIGRTLGVAHLLEGRVRRAGDRVVLNVILTDARNGRQIWAERYDRTLADSLTLQGELATEIAAALRATLSPEEKAQVETRPTANPEAYLRYLQARTYDSRSDFMYEHYQMAVALYKQAVTLDPAFALAHARLSMALTVLFLNGQTTPEIKAQARAEAQEAARQQPELGEALLAQALCTYRLDRNYDGALREMDIAARLLPNSAEIDLLRAAIQRRQGRWPEALASFEKSLAHDPRNPQPARGLLMTRIDVRDWPAAERDVDRAQTLAPDDPMLAYTRACVRFFAQGDVAAVRAAARGLPSGWNPDGTATFVRWDAALLARDFPGAEAAVATNVPDRVVNGYGMGLPPDYLRGCIYLANGEVARARECFEKARPAMEAEVRDVPRDALRHGQVGLLYAYLGRREDATEEGRRAVELQQQSRDATIAPTANAFLALILARTGQPDEALALIEHLLNTPAAAQIYSETSITKADLRCRWQWDPLRGDPRFAALTDK